MSGLIRPHRHRAGRFELIDQRRLPHHETWLEIDSPEQAAAAIRDMVVRGAPAIGLTAAWGLATLGAAAGDETRWQDACRTLAGSRPTAVNLHWAIRRMSDRRASAQAQGEALAEALRLEAEAIETEDLAMNRRIGETGAAAIPGDNLRILTHCNTGGLATAGWGTALGVVRSLHAQGRLAEAWATETRPYWQGARLTAWEMQRDGLPGRLIPDSAVGAALAGQNIDAVVVGADRIAADGSVANKIGTYTIAVLAARHGVPFFVAAPGSTVDPDCPDGSRIPIELRDERELTEALGQAVAPAGTPAWNPAFDVTPPDLIKGLILDCGLVSPVSTENLRAALCRPEPRS